jgi:hypothetical protein
MQEHNEEAEASIPTDAEIDSPDHNGQFAVRRKAAKCTLPWDLKAGELDLVSPSQAEEIRATKRPRFEEPFSATTDEAPTKISSLDTAVYLPAATTADADHADKAGELNLMSPSQAEETQTTKKRRLEKPLSATADEVPTKISSLDTAVNIPAATTTDADHADQDPVKLTHWTTEEDAKLTSAVTNTRKKKWDTEYKTDWPAIATLVPGRTKVQCWSRWRDVLDPNIDRATERTGSWAGDEDIKLKDAVQTHGGKNWGAITALVPGRDEKQCWKRWNNHLDPSIERECGRAGRWTADEDSILKEAAKTHGGKNWGAIAALVPGRSEKQCWSRWRDALDPSIERRTGKWTAAEDSKLRDAKQIYGDKNWAAIAALVPGRAEKQCYNRWNDRLKSSVDPTPGRKGSWAADEDSKLKDAVKTHGVKNWDAIAALVSGRTKVQCSNRWKNASDPSIDRERGRSCKWTAVEDNKLKDALQMHSSKNWVAIAALIPGRTKFQCQVRWKNVLDPSIDRANERTGEWSEDEDIKLKDAVQTHGGKNWCAIAALVPGRAEKKCWARWQFVLDPNTKRVSGRKGRWTADEDSKLKDAVQTHGDKKWGPIAELVPDRVESQCRQRWKHILAKITL